MVVGGASAMVRPPAGGGVRGFGWTGPGRRAERHSGAF